MQDLKAEGGNGSSDPVVYVDVMGKKQHTKIKKGTLSCVYDDLFFFNFKGLEPEEIEEGVIKVSVFNANKVMRNEMIGAATFDMTFVYLKEHHELHKQVRNFCSALWCPA